MLTNENARLLSEIGVDDPASVSEFRMMRDTLNDLMNAVRQEERERPGYLPTAADLETIGAIGRKPTISKHRAANLAHIRDTVAALDAAGLTEAADTLVWSVWWRVLDRQREEFLLADANRQIKALTHD